MLVLIYEKHLIFITLWLLLRHCILLPVWISTHTPTFSWCWFFSFAFFFPWVFFSMSPCRACVEMSVFIVVHLLCVSYSPASLSEPQNKYAIYLTNDWLVLFALILHVSLGVITVRFYTCTVCCFCVLIYICGFVSVSAENLEKSLRQMERQLLQLEKDLETFSSHDDPNDMFFTKMAISFTHAFVHSVVWEIIQGAYSRAAMDLKKCRWRMLFSYKTKSKTTSVIFITLLNGSMNWYQGHLRTRMFSKAFHQFFSVVKSAN